MNILITASRTMSDVVVEPAQEPPDVTDVGSHGLEGVSDTAHSCLDPAKSGADLPSTTSPASECVASREDAVESRQSVATADCLVSEGAI